MCVCVCSDSLVGTDSHTTMIDGLGVVGWGVGGIEAEAVMLGQVRPSITRPTTHPPTNPPAAMGVCSSLPLFSSHFSRYRWCCPR